MGRASSGSLFGYQEPLCTRTSQQRCFTRTRQLITGARMNKQGLTLALLSDSFAVCRLRADENIPNWALSSSFCSLTRTPDELSVVCSQELVPEEVQAVRGWRSLKVEGKLDLTLVGILSSLTSSLAHVGIVVFVISTYDTDYVFVKEGDLDRAVTALRNAGHDVR